MFIIGTSTSASEARAKMWPKKLDYTKNECRAKLRNIELTAYGSVMNAMRAQGTLSEDKTRILKDLRAIFHINDDRHKAEARRVANDEQLTTIADVIAGYETYREWAKEGRRAVPLLPRGIAETALIKVADALTQRIAEENAKLPYPVDTERDRRQDDIVPFIEEKKHEVIEIKSDLQQLSDVAVAVQAQNEAALVQQQQLQLQQQLHEDNYNSGWSRKRRSSVENMTLNQQLYPNVMKAQMSGKKGTKRPRKEKKSKNVAPPPLFPKIDFEESINRIQEKERNQGFNRIIHSYASAPAVPQHLSQQSAGGHGHGPAQNQMNMISEAYRQQQQHNYPQQQQMSPNTLNILQVRSQLQGLPPSPHHLPPEDQHQFQYQLNNSQASSQQSLNSTTMAGGYERSQQHPQHQLQQVQENSHQSNHHQSQTHAANRQLQLPPLSSPLPSSNATASASTSSLSVATSCNTTQSLYNQSHQQQPQSMYSSTNMIVDKPEPKVQILSNQPVKLISPLSLKTLQARGNVKVVQSPPGKVVLRPLSDQADTKITQIKGMATSVAGAKLNVQLMPMQTKPRPNFLIVKPGDTAIPGNTGATPTKPFPVQIVNTNGESKTTTFVRSISSTPSNSSNLPTLKLDAAQLQKIRIVPAGIKNSVTGATSSANNSVSSGGNKVIFTTSSNVKLPTTQIKISKSSKLYPITYNNGTPASIVIDKKPASNPMFLKGSSQLTYQQYSSDQINSDGHNASNSSLDNLSFDDIIEEDSGDDDTDKTISQEEQSDLEVTCEIEGTTAIYKKNPSLDMLSNTSDDAKVKEQVEDVLTAMDVMVEEAQTPEKASKDKYDKLSQLTKDLLED